MAALAGVLGAPASPPSESMLRRTLDKAVTSANITRLQAVRAQIIHPEEALPNEEWLETAFEGYFVSSLGRVRGRRGRVLKQNDTYPVVDCGKGNPQRVHILDCTAWHGPRPDEMHAAHIDRNPQTTRPPTCAGPLQRKTAQTGLSTELLNPGRTATWHN